VVVVVVVVVVVASSGQYATRVAIQLRYTRHNGDGRRTLCSSNSQQVRSGCRFRPRHVQVE